MYIQLFKLKLELTDLLFFALSCIHSILSHVFISSSSFMLGFRKRSKYKQKNQASQQAGQQMITTTMTITVFYATVIAAAAVFDICAIAITT